MVLMVTMVLMVLVVMRMGVLLLAFDWSDGT